MDVFILGGTGNAGRALIKMALEDGHLVTAYIRNRAKFEAAFPDAPDALQVVEGEISDTTLLRRAMQGHDVVINAAGNANGGPSYQPFVANIIAVAQDALPSGARFWLFGGAAVLIVPGADFTMLRFRQVPKIFQAHGENLERIEQTNLDWSMMCPGPMVSSENGQPHEGLRISRNDWPVVRPPFTKFLPKINVLVAFVRKVPEMTITYEDAARVILDHLEPDGPFSKARVGVALPVGKKLNKKSVQNA
ncbi:NAD(P)-dependent oxidoreductase [Ruegeria halocynthiae]|uniref:NAD(P)-dependent oxidoreductase n=1 Tax=Ruegeria halocynthiae TaxID=985054 RepID=UPI0005641850|nr:NAD(P)H-binding protein [Ruegeria halocynthiae]